jgi:bifunctional DNA-binding transcriptional regulator/antitoxin component of YhaV-PrlF toxin-antitoxin module
MSILKLTRQRRVTLPEPLLSRAGLTAGDMVIAYAWEGEVRLRRITAPKQTAIEQVAGCLSRRIDPRWRGGFPTRADTRLP